MTTLHSPSDSDRQQSKRKRTFSGDAPRQLMKNEKLHTIILDKTQHEEIHSEPTKRPHLNLRIEIPISLNSGQTSHTEEVDPDSEKADSLFSAQTTDSLFDSDDFDESIPTTVQESLEDTQNNRPAIITRPAIPGLYFYPSLLIPQKLADSVVAFCMETYFLDPESNQVMLFGRFLPSDSGSSPKSNKGLPEVLIELLAAISSLLKPVLPQDIQSLLFPPKPKMARQAIINLYQPGEGIAPHVDLLNRYGDGILGVSFSSGAAMRFDRLDPSTDDAQTRWDIYLPERSIIILSDEARYGWTHGIEKKKRDLISSVGNTHGSWKERGTRMSVTFRWLLPGADVVGE